MATCYPIPEGSVKVTDEGIVYHACMDYHVQYYDMNGRLVHSQDLTENVTAIDAEDWAEGVYVWKVLSNGKEVEKGKWVKA